MFKPTATLAEPSEVGPKTCRTLVPLAFFSGRFTLTASGPPPKLMVVTPLPLLPILIVWTPDPLPMFSVWVWLSLPMFSTGPAASTCQSLILLASKSLFMSRLTRVPPTPVEELVALARSALIGAISALIEKIELSIISCTLASFIPLSDSLVRI